jgi:DNA adenine methylase
MPGIKPFLRWAGGKQWLATRLAQFLDATNSEYYEPFLGGGSVFFSLQPKRATLGDLNIELVNAYLAVRDNPNRLISYLEQWPNDKKTYYNLRSRTFNDPIEKAARFIYLNRTCWNGLYRVNRAGRFNVPFAGHNRAIFTREVIIRASQALAGVELKAGDFSGIVAEAQRGAIIYFDPPYVSTGNSNGFRRYNDKIFAWKDQKRLADIAQALDARGCIVIISNAGVSEVASLFDSFWISAVSRASNLSIKGDRRPPVEELLITNSEKLYKLFSNLKE